MSATMAGRWQAVGMRQTGLIKGVCARIAERAGVPVWMPRAAFLLFGVLHWLLAVIAYVVMVKLFNRGARGGFTVVPAGPPASAVQNRFSALDARLAAMEATTLQQETTLRRAFQDLERS